MKIDHLTPDDWAHIDPTPAQRLARKLITRPGEILYRYKAYGHWPRVPRTGGFLLAPGPHGSYMDPFVFTLGQARTRMRFMAMYEALEWPLIGRIIRWGGGFPVHRNNARSTDALSVARRIVESGDGLVVFMEGRMVLEHPGLGEPKTGLARLALWTGAPVVPVAAYGAKRPRAYGKKFHWPRVTVVWGSPLLFAKEENPTAQRIREVTDQIWAEVSRLYNHAQEIDRLGRPDNYEVPDRAII